MPWIPRSSKLRSFLLDEMRKRLDQAASIAKAAQVVAEGGNVEKAVEIVLDVEQLGRGLINAQP
jgi:hypothetical protein